MAEKHFAALVSEIPPGSRKIVRVANRSIGIYNLSGQFYALRNLCPHQGAELCKGLVTPWVDVDAEGNVTFEREGEIVRCPWHQWEFDIKTGCVIVDPKLRTRSYEVTVEKYDLTVDQEQIYVHI